MQINSQQQQQRKLLSFICKMQKRNKYKTKWMLEQKVLFFGELIEKLVKYLVTVLIVNVWHTHRLESGLFQCLILFCFAVCLFLLFDGFFRFFWAIVWWVYWLRLLDNSPDFYCSSRQRSMQSPTLKIQIKIKIFVRNNNSNKLNKSLSSNLLCFYRYFWALV